MLTISELTTLLGWASLLNIAYLCLAALALIFMRKVLFSIHGKIFDVDENELGALYFSFLSAYKVATLVFIVVPYIALKIMGH
jgi:uncharacterized membrane protein